MRGSTLLLLVVLATPAAAQLDGLLPPHPAGAPIVERLFITSESANVPFWGAFDTWTRAYVDLREDGGADIVAHNDDGRTFIFDGAGRALAAHLVERPAGSPLRDLNGAVVADVDKDGNMDVLVATSTGKTVRLEVTKTPDGLALERLWSVQLGPMDAPATLADADGDGRLEAFLQADGQAGHYALRADGTRLWTTETGDGNAAPRAADLDGDGDLEVVFATDNGHVHAYEAATGNLLWTSRVEASPGSVPVAPAAADLDGDGTLEVVVAARNIATGGADWIARSHAVIAAFGADGRARWTFTADWLNPLVGAEPVVRDGDGDGDLDLLFVDWNTPGHKPGSWERLPKAHAFALDGAGKLLWMHEFPVYWSNRAPVILDVTGDATPEIVLVDERDDRSGILLLSLAGAELGRYPLREGWLANRGAEPADLDGDGRVELVVPMARDATGCPWSACREGALAVLDTRGSAAQLSTPLLPVGRAPVDEGPGAPTRTGGEGRIVGTVFGAGGEPVAGARITVDDGTTATTDDAGKFNATVPSGRRTITVKAPGHATQVLGTDVPIGADRTLTITLLREQASVRGAPALGLAFAALGLAAAGLVLRRR